MVLVHDNDLKHILGATDTNQTVSKDHTSISTIFDSVAPGNLRASCSDGLSRKVEAWDWGDVR